MSLRDLFKSYQEPSRTQRLYESVVAQARIPDFYRRWGVPDTLDGRFEMIALHLFLVLHRLKGGDAESAAMAQELHDLFFSDMDQSLREMGAGDLGVGKRVKRMATGFYGRVAAYDEGLGAEDDRLEAALRRNLYGTAMPEALVIAAMAAYMRREAAALAARDTRSLVEGNLVFGAPAGGPCHPTGS